MMKRSFKYSWGTKPLGQPWQSIGLAVVGIICSTIAIYTYLTTSNFLKSSIETTGTVVQLIRRGDRYYPVVTYHHPNKKKLTLYSSTGSYPPRFSVNEKIPIVYLPSNPSEARIKEFWSLWLSTFVAGVLGGCSLLGAILVWIYRHRFFSLAGYPELSGSNQTDKD